ncbi:MAG: endonuclease [Gemmataceae bacterium]
MTFALLGGVLAVAGFAAPAAEWPQARGEYVTVGSLRSPHATQAAAADAATVYAVSSTTVARYDRATGKALGVSTGQAEHLNSGFLWQGKLYCAHSNYPKRPHRSDLRVLDPATMRLEMYHTFADPPGSLTWAVRRGDAWWCHFAHYGRDNHRSVLVRYDDRWREIGRWTYPKELVADWGSYSLSGGLWDGDSLLATGHDKKVIYRLRVPPTGRVVEVADVVRSPFPGQGIAADPNTGGLVGIDRDGGAVLFARFVTK